MSIFEQLKNNKGTVSSLLGKQLAREALNGNLEILEEAVDLSGYCLKDKKEKNIRSGAAKIVECVAFENPALVSKYLEKLIPPLEVAEPQTRWMIIRVMGLCAAFKPEIAKKALPYAQKFIREKVEGQLCLVSSADLFLGDYGALSAQTAGETYPLLLESTDNIIMNEHDWIIEAFMNIVRYLNAGEKKVVLGFANEYRDHPRKATRERVRKLASLCQ